MDIVFKIAGKKTDVFIGASNCGYDDTMLKICDIVLRKIRNICVSDEEEGFLKEKCFIFDGRNEQDIEVFIDVLNQNIYFESKWNIKELEKTEEYEKSEKTDFENEKLLFSQTLTFDEFDVLYRFLKKIKSNCVIINNKYILKLSHKG